ncbi:ABC transporter ATP-binding protein [Pseudomonas frederiksbergensis]|uniref:Amino acid ABC transporter ATP-binding protein n=1 Tax=Pseudomonas frederiksbergensis TaxID=104087 RepID=A0A0B1YX99_9PSED|nr:ATP-binding cassette domain-containing protein [Pseudomonas frederiksbergensis]KHK61553.1 amino acid ABC transporter ATP-binding protein [Pseudomonas frederiksbergensis]
MHKILLELHDVQKSYGENHVLRGVNFSIAQGEIVGLLGPNGCGKSSLINLISGFTSADSGKVGFDNRDISAASVEHIVQQGLLRTFQLPSMPTRMTVEEVLMGGAPPKNIRDIIRTSVEEVREVHELLKNLGLMNVRNIRAASLSGGQKKLLSIALALRNKPKLICLDEPTAGVHPNLRHDMVRLLRSVNAHGVSMLIIEHDMHFIREICNRCIVLDRGEVIADCKPSELTSNTKVVEAYLGKARDKGVPVD